MNSDSIHSSVGRVNSRKNGGEPPCLRYFRTPIRQSPRACLSNARGAFGEGGNPSVELPVLEPASIGPRSFNRGNCATCKAHYKQSAGLSSEYLLVQWPPRDRQPERG